MRRIIDCLSHPSMIAKYFSDKFYIPLVYFLSLLSLSVLIIGLYSFKGSYINYTYSSNVVSQVRYSDAEFEFKDNILYTNSAQTIKGNGIIINFNKKDFVNDYSLQMKYNFKETEVDVYFLNFFKKSYKYEDLNLNGVSNTNLKNNTSYVLDFENAIYEISKSFDNNFKLISFSESLTNLLSSFLILFVVCMVIATFVNPQIEFVTRLKLVLYDASIFFVFIMFTFMFSINWIQFVGYAASLIYTVITFKHIRRIKVVRQ